MVLTHCQSQIDNAQLAFSVESRWSSYCSIGNRILLDMERNIPQGSYSSMELVAIKTDQVPVAVTACP